MNIDKVVNILKDGKLVVLATDTTYGIMGDATNINAINKVYKAKKRVKNKPLIILVSNIDMLKKCVKDINKIEAELIENYWPGPLTILFTKSEYINDSVTSNTSLVGIRCPNNKNLIEIINKLNRPLFSTSANISGQETITTINNLESELLKYIDYFYDSGEIISEASTIVHVKNKHVEILREGKLKPSLFYKYQEKRKEC